MKGVLRRAVVGLGSNLGDREGALRAAVVFLRGLHEGKGEDFLVSRFYETRPIDCEEGTPMFLNGVVCLMVGKEPLELLDELLNYEQRFGRPAVRERNLPRVIDLDLLMVGEERWADERLQLPHPRMAGRLFVLEPLAEILPDLYLPGVGMRVVDARDLLRKQSL